MVDQIKYMFHVAKSLEGGGNFLIIFEKLPFYKFKIWCVLLSLFIISNYFLGTLSLHRSIFMKTDHFCLSQ